jgi:hypothetical protein
MRKIRTTMACVAIGIVIIVATTGSLAEISVWGLPISSIAQTSLPTIDTALTNPRPSTIDTAAASRSGVNDSSCKDFDFSFLNSACSKIHKKRAARKIHRIATLVMGHRDATP